MAKRINATKKPLEMTVPDSEPDYSKIVTPELIALRRAAKEAIRIALETGTHAWVLVDGKIVDAARPVKPPRAKKKVATKNRKLPKAKPIVKPKKMTK